MSTELEYPVVAHHRIIVNADRRDDERVKALFASFDLTEPVTLGNVSSSGKYVSYAVSVRLSGPEETARLDAAIKDVPGIKMCL